MKKENLIYSTLILTIASIITRIIGMIFRIYLSNKIGAVGMGLYQMILSVYSFTSTFATSGIVVAVSSLVSSHLARHEGRCAKYIMHFCICLSIALGLTAGVVLYFGSEPISMLLIKDANAAFSLKILAPGLTFMSLSSCYRGYFLAISKVSKPAIAMIIEQLSRMMVIVAFMGIWLPLGIQYACAAAVIGMTASEIISALYMYFVYLRNTAPLKENSASECNDQKRSLIKSVLKMAVPVAVSSYLQSTLRLVENILLPNSLKKYAGNNDSGMGVYGSLKGMVMPLLMFPSVFLSSLSVSLVPEISRSISIDNTKRVNMTLNRVFKITLLTSIMIVAVFLTFSHELGIALYNSSEVGMMLAMLAPLCPFMYLEIVVSGILRGLNEQLCSLKYNTVDSVMRIVLIFLIVPYRGLYGFIIIMYLSNIYTSMSGIIRLLKVTTVSFNMKDWLLKPCVAALISAMFFKGIFRFIIPTGINIWLSLILSIFLLCSSYIFLLVLTRCIHKNELRWIGKKLKAPAGKKQNKEVSITSLFL